MLAGGLLLVGEAEHVLGAGELPLDLVGLLGAVEAHDGVEVAERAHQVAVLVQAHGVEVHVVGSVHGLVGEVVGGWCRIGLGHTVDLGIVDALPVPYDLAVVDLLKVGVDDLLALVAGVIVDGVLDVTGQDVMVEVYHQEIVSVDRMSLANSSGLLEGDLLHRVEVGIHDDTVAGRVSWQTVLVETAVLRMVAVVGLAVDDVLLEVPITGLHTVVLVVGVLGPYDVPLPVEHHDVLSVDEGDVEVAGKVGGPLDVVDGESVGHLETVVAGDVDETYDGDAGSYH